MTVSTKDLWEASKAASVGKTASTQEVHPADDGYLPPVTSVKLPSRGVVYPPESPLYLVDSVDIKAVTASEENILSSQTLIKKGTVLSVLMKACITNRSIDPEEMLLGDRNAVLTAIRVSAYGAKYPVEVTCPSCGEESEHEFDLSRLTMKTLDVEPVGGPGTNEFAFKLPGSGRMANFRLLDANGLSKLERDTEQVRKRTGNDQGVTMRLYAQVTRIDGVDPSMLAKAINSMSAFDARALRQYMDEIAPGIDMLQDYTCPKCAENREVVIPLGMGFFWPTRVG